MTIQSEKLTRNRILESFHSYGCPPEKNLIGGEYERHIVDFKGRSTSYDEEYGIQWFLQEFSRRWNWDPYYESENIIALYKDGASITLEPGGQFELSGRTHSDLSDLQKEFVENRKCLLELSQEANKIPITCGLTPIMDISDIKWMPKGRYKVMREYLPKKGALAHYMMKGTTSVQCNYDFENELDCAKKVHLCSGIAPITTAIFANSPLYKNKPTSYISFRGHIWTQTDPDRCGFPPGLRNDYSHEKWIDYLLDVPMMFIHREEWLYANGRTFREFMTTGIDGHIANWDDWELHMTSVFPEVRIKKTIEVRGADCIRHDLAVAFCALFTGLLYDKKSLDQGLEIVAEFTSILDREQRFAIACKDGLQGKVGNAKLLDFAEKIIDISRNGLQRYQPHNVHLLKPLIEQVSKGKSPGHELLEVWKKDASIENILRHIAY
jgi:glutamate--cysteine ligase